jgi:hypothetical protein
MTPIPEDPALSAVQRHYSTSTSLIAKYVTERVTLAQAKLDAGRLDDHDAGLTRLSPAAHGQAVRNVRMFLFSNLGSPEVFRLAATSWAAADILEKILDESAMLPLD